MIKKNKNYFFFALLLSLVYACQSKNEDKFEWNAGISAPQNYIAGGPFVEFFHDGKSVAGVSSNVGISPGWETTSGGYTGGEKLKPIPDSLFVSWRCGTDLTEYKTSFKLPYEKIRELFKNNNKRANVYSTIAVGMAPGGIVAVWVKEGDKSFEVYRTKAKSIGVTDKSDPNSVTLWTSTGEDAKNILKYLYLYGIPYPVWEKRESIYKYNLGFSSSQDLAFSNRVHMLSKDGSYIFFNEDAIQISNEDWMSNTIKSETKEGKLPVNMSVQWISRDDQQWYEGEIVMPNDFKSTFETFYKNNKGVNIVLVMDKVNPMENFSYGSVWLASTSSKEQIMRFRLSKLNIKTRKFEVSKYSLPKNYIIPKWEGRVPIKVPTDFEYYQEK